MGHLLYLIFRCDRRCDGKFGKFAETKHTPDFRNYACWPQFLEGQTFALAWPGLSCIGLGSSGSSILDKWTVPETWGPTRCPSLQDFSRHGSVASDRRSLPDYCYCWIGARPAIAIRNQGSCPRRRDSKYDALKRGDEKRLSKLGPSPARFDDD